MFLKIKEFIGNRFALHLEHKVNVIPEGQFSVSGKIAFWIQAEQGKDFFQLGNAVFESVF